MKRKGLLCAAAVVALLMGLGLPAMAATTLGVAGEVTYGVIDNGTKVGDGWNNAYANFIASIDANNLVALELYANALPTIAAPASGPGKLVAPNVNFFYLKSDIGGNLGLDTKTIDPVLYAGYGVFDLPDYNVTQYGSEGISALGIDNGGDDGIFGSEAGSAYGILALNTTVMNMVNVVLATSGTALAAVSATNSPQALVGAYGTFGPVSVEAGWTMHGTASGYIPVGVKFSSTMGNIGLAAMGQYVANLNAGGVGNWAAGLAATFMSNYTVDFAVLSYEPSYEPTVAAIKGTGDIVLNFAKNFGAVVSVFLNFDPNAAAAFDTLEASVWTTFGPAKVRLGYLYGATGLHNLGTPNLNAPGNNAGQGGVYLTTDLSF
jgi:hypothetical protein